MHLAVIFSLSNVKKAPGEFGIIHNLSFPKNQSVKSSIPKSNSQVKYKSIEYYYHCYSINQTVWLQRIDGKNGHSRWFPEYPCSSC